MRQRPRDSRWPFEWDCLWQRHRFSLGTTSGCSLGKCSANNCCHPTVTRFAASRNPYLSLHRSFVDVLGANIRRMNQAVLRLETQLMIGTTRAMTNRRWIISPATRKPKPRCSVRHAAPPRARGTRPSSDACFPLRNLLHWRIWRAGLLNNVLIFASTRLSNSDHSLRGCALYLGVSAWGFPGHSVVRNRSRL